MTKIEDIFLCANYICYIYSWIIEFHSFIAHNVASSSLYTFLDWVCKVSPNSGETFTTFFSKSAVIYKVTVTQLTFKILICKLS